ncbi:TPA: site-specific DNA-methyltransferase [Escherichia coli]|nr:site-specific DNA-methyltransferase [Escherichia coli]EHJ8765850.1 site-specific DNA-methyltransferase [Escherichia coli]EHL4989587.1 site-specific DNA-methyltransferase [Escherichia coli]EHL5000491.1 site-specific DNA-methyltransferase [Escherichia coli]EHL5606093.1 site-specific DNA-methyltransferase [Escherichia coli]
MYYFDSGVLFLTGFQQRIVTENTRLYCGDALAVLPHIEPDSVDALITDPPYSSGATHKAGRSLQGSHAKYLNSESLHRFEGFAGENMYACSWAYWMQLWMMQAYRAVRPGGYALVFSDWRQLPALTDAFQASGFTWRGIVVWNKGRAARTPHVGYFRHQCEFMVWGSKGHLDKSPNGPFDGCMSFPVRPQKKLHPTGKPEALMAELIRTAGDGGTVLDPFMGSGTTGVAALKAGCKFIGIETSPHYFSVTVERLRQAQLIPAAA